MLLVLVGWRVANCFGFNILFYERISIMNAFNTDVTQQQQQLNKVIVLALVRFHAESFECLVELKLKLLFLPQLGLCVNGKC